VYSQLHIRSETESSDLFVHPNVSFLSAFFPRRFKMHRNIQGAFQLVLLLVRPSGPYRRPSGASAVTAQCAYCYEDSE